MTETLFGVHTGLQHTSLAELVPLWRRIEELGFGYISIWDHLYAADVSGDPTSLEAVTSHTVLATCTDTVRVGANVYCVLFRHPAILARAIANIDHVSGGRAEIGLGAGWLQQEFSEHGIPFPPVPERLDALDEAVQCVRGLLHDGEMTFEGKHFTLAGARLAPRPVQEHLPVSVGGGGERRTLAIVARHADGWNVPFVSPETFAHKRGVLASHCETAGRNVGGIRCSVNVGVALDEEHLKEQFGVTAEFVRPGVLMGSESQMVEQVRRYEEAGADQVNLAIRAPFAVEALERFASALL